MTDRTFDVSNDTHDDMDTRGTCVPVGIEEKGDGDTSRRERSWREWSPTHPPRKPVLRQGP